MVGNTDNCMRVVGNISDRLETVDLGLQLAKKSTLRPSRNGPLSNRQYTHYTTIYTVSTTLTNFLIYSEVADSNLYIWKHFLIYKVKT